MKKSLPFICLLTVGLANFVYVPHGVAGTDNFTLTNKTYPNRGTEELKEKAAQQWQDHREASPITTDSGEILYAYGHSHPTIECAPLHVCVIHLMADEKISSLSLGDSVRWIVQTGQAGNRAVVVLKPTEEKLTTNLVITTTASRIYYLNLISSQQHYLPMIGFYDPEQLIQQVLDKQDKLNQQKKDTIATLPSLKVEDINFSYWCEGADVLPERVFSSSGKVFIQMPKAWIEGKAPTLFVFENGKEVLTNYELRNNYYVVNHLFQEAHLIFGNPDERQTIRIHAGERPYLSSWFH